MNELKKFLRNAIDIEWENTRWGDKLIQAPNTFVME